MRIFAFTWAEWLDVMEFTVNKESVEVITLLQRNNFIIHLKLRLTFSSLSFTGRFLFFWSVSSFHPIHQHSELRMYICSYQILIIAHEYINNHFFTSFLK